MQCQIPGHYACIWAAGLCSSDVCGYEILYEPCLRFEPSLLPSEGCQTVEILANSLQLRPSHALKIAGESIQGFLGRVRLDDLFVGAVQKNNRMEHGK